MKRKAQAAMEFLTTYGWAILIITVVLGGLGYMGVFSPSTYVKSSCQFDAGLACPIFMSYCDNSGNCYIDMGLQNNFNNKIEITKMIIVNPQDETSECTADVDNLGEIELISDPGDPVLLSSYGQAQQRDIRFNFGSACDLLEESVNNKQRFDIKLYYIKGDATMPSVTAGKLITIVDNRTS